MRYLQNCIHLLSSHSFFLQRNGGAKDSVPVAEERSVVTARLLVVHVMSWCTPQQTKGHQVVEGPRQVIAYVVLHRHPDTENCDAPGGQWVALQKNRVLVAPESNSHQFWDAELLRRPGERRHVFMVDCVDPPVKLWVLVMYEMPNIVLSVKEEKHSQSVNEYLT